MGAFRAHSPIWVYYRVPRLDNDGADGKTSHGDNRQEVSNRENHIVSNHQCSSIGIIGPVRKEPGLDRLSKTLRGALRKAIETDCDLDKMDEGLTDHELLRLAVDLETLKGMGFIAAEEIDGAPVLTVTAKGLDYRRERVITIAKFVGRCAFQFAVGVCGGVLAAWITLAATGH